MQELNEKANPNILITLVGNKIDLDGHQITKGEAEEYAKSKGLQYYEVSAKLNENVGGLFKDIAMKLPAQSSNHRGGSRLKDSKKKAEEDGYCASC